MPQDSYNGISAPDHGTTDNGTTDDGTTDDGTPDDGTPDDGTPDDGTPDDGTPGNGTPGNGTTGSGTTGSGLADDGLARDGLVVALRQRTRGLHAAAERSGIIREVLRGTASRYSYALLLRTLLPAYEALEAGLERHRAAGVLAALARREVYRASAIEADLAALVGRDWRQTLPLLASGQRYADRVAAAASGDGAGLLAHAYTRFLGDLSGGRVMAGRLAGILPPLPGGLRFHEFPAIADLAAFKRAYLAALDDAGRRVGDQQAIVEEAAEAFICNIAVSEEVRAKAVSVGTTTAFDLNQTVHPFPLSI
jgi:heme oxygenase